MGCASRALLSATDSHGHEPSKDGLDRIRSDAYFWGCGNGGLTSKIALYDRLAVNVPISKTIHDVSS